MQRFMNYILIPLPNCFSAGSSVGAGGWLGVGLSRRWVLALGIPKPEDKSLSHNPCLRFPDVPICFCSLDSIHTPVSGIFSVQPFESETQHSNSFSCNI